jgi:hypothetical protein
MTYIRKMEILKQNRYILVNTWIRILIETYLDLLIAALLCISLPKAVEKVDMSLADKVNYVSAIIVISVLIAFTGVIIWFAVYQFREPIKEAKFKL